MNNEMKRCQSVKMENTNYSDETRSDSEDEMNDALDMFDKALAAVVASK